MTISKHIAGTMSIIVLVAASFAGCQSQKQATQQSAAASVKSFQASLEQMPGRIDRLQLLAMELRSDANTNKAATLAEFSRQLTEVNADAKNITHEYDVASNNMNRYYRAWVQDSRKIKDPATRDKALAQIDAGKANTATAQEYMKEASNYYRKMMDSARDIENGLKADMAKSSSAWFNQQMIVFTESATGAKSRVERLDELITQSLTK